MPIYEYDCNDCNKTFSLLKGMSDVSAVSCPQCSSLNTKKKLSTFSCCGTDSGSSAGSHNIPGHG